MPKFMLVSRIAQSGQNLALSHLAINRTRTENDLLNSTVHVPLVGKADSHLLIRRTNLQQHGLYIGKFRIRGSN